MSITSRTHSFLGDLAGHKPTAPAPSSTPPVEAPQKPDPQKAAAALYARLGTVQADDSVQIPVPPKTRSLHQARLLARAFGTHAEMRALGIPEEEVVQYLDPTDPTPKKAPAAPPPSSPNFGPAPAPTAPAPRPEETPPHFCQPGVRPVIGQCVHGYVPTGPGCTVRLVEETYTGFRNLGVETADSPDPVVRLVNPRFGVDRQSRTTLYRHAADPTAAVRDPDPVKRSYPNTWHRSSECPFEKKA